MGQSGQPAPIELKVEYRMLNAFYADYARNISRGHTSIRTDKLLPLGTRFVFRMQLPHMDAPFFLAGEVVSQKLEGGEGGVQIQFIYGSEEDRRAFEAWVEQQMVQSLGPDISKKLLGRAPRLEATAP
jgi:type IV pilus assembly protein PilZ